MLPNFVVIGAQKSASTFLHSCLNDHPEIYLPQEEIPFFETPEYEQSDIEELESLFENRSEKCLGIKRPAYIGKPEVPGRIESDLPEARLIAVLRSPVDRAISAYYHNINGGFIPLLDLEFGIRQLIMDPFYAEKYRRSSEIIEFGLYSKYLRQYGHFIKNDQLLVLLHEDILARPLECVQRVYEFLDVSVDFTPRSLNSRPQKVVYNLWRLKFLSLRSRYLYQYNEERTRAYPDQMSFIKKSVSRLITMADRRVLSLLFSNQKPDVSPELEKMLYGQYAKDIDSLEDLLCRDLTAWRPKDIPNS